MKITDAQAQQAKTGQSPDQVVASLDTSVRTGKDSSNSLAKNWNGNELREDVEAQAKITQAFGQQAAKMVGSYADAKEKELRQAASTAAQNGDQTQADQLSAEADQWKEGGAYRAGAHTAIGLLAGGVSGALGAAASSALMPDIAEQIKKLGLPAEVESAVSLAAAAGVGAAVGGGAGAASAFNVDLNNRQIHEDKKAKEKTLAKQLAEKSNGKYSYDQIQNALRAANNLVLGETILSGMIIPYDGKSLMRIYDADGFMLGKRSDGSFALIQNPQVLIPPSADLQEFIKNQTDGQYSWDDKLRDRNSALWPLPVVLNGTGKTPDYFSLQGSFYVASGGIAINLHNGDIFGQWSLGRAYPGYTSTPGMSMIFGKIIGTANAVSTSDFLKGGGGSASYFYPLPAAPIVGIGGGINHSYGGQTAVEAGLSFPPGATANPAGYGFDLDVGQPKEVKK
ncbi:polymorphic toxin type 22 domain-containing protein [Herbaspirillum huttiense]|uniref:polymorphic toxin type 22 domain-containing protein n=1 Tax=Herbaspirillum huttiense TaxID=863372 RepID=UPI0031E0493D